MQPIPSLTYMDGETISALAARVQREIDTLAERQENDMAQESPTYEHNHRLAELLGVSGSLANVIDFLNGEHAAFHEARNAAKPDHSDREQFREGAI